MVFRGELDIKIILEFGGFSGHLIDKLTLGGTVFINEGSIKDHLFIEDVEGVMEFVDAGKVGELLIRVAALAGVSH